MYPCNSFIYINIYRFNLVESEMALQAIKKSFKEYIYSSNPWESNYRDGSMGHKTSINEFNFQGDS